MSLEARENTWLCPGARIVLGRLLLLVGAAGLLLVAACGRHHQLASLPPDSDSPAQSPAVATPGTAPLGVALPAPNSLRTVSDAQDTRFAYGVQRQPALCSTDVVLDNYDAVLHPNWDGTTNFKPSWAGFAFDMTGYSGPGQARAKASTTPAGAPDLCFFALANWQTNHWDWFAGTPNVDLTLPAFTPYVRGTDQALDMVVLALGTAPLTLNWLRVGTDIPAVLQPIKVTPKSGPAPLDTTFDLTSCRDNDTPFFVYIDYEGTGNFVEAYTGLVNHHTYLADKTYDAVVRFSDVRAPTGGNFVDVPQTITVSGKAPTVRFTANQTLCPASTVVQFNGSASLDPDGTIADYAWDFDGDGTYDANSPTLSMASHLYVTPGVYHPTLRCTDNANFKATYSLNVVVYAGGVCEVENNDSSTDKEELPSAPFSGFTGDVGPTGVMDGDTVDWYNLHISDPGLYTFTLTFSGDPGATPMLYVFGDLSYMDNTYAKVQGNQATFTGCMQVGDVALWLQANDPAKSFSYSLAVSAVHSELPVLTLHGDATSGAAPYQAHYSAAGSFDPDGTIVKYEWDCYGDGDYEFDTGTTPEVTFTQQRVGDFYVTLRATDNMGAHAYAKLPIYVTGDGLDEIEPHGQESDPQVLNLPVLGFRGDIGSNEDAGWIYDYYKFSVGGGPCTLHTDLGAVDPITGDVQMRLAQVQPDNSLLYVKSLNTMGTAGGQLTFDVPSAGSYVLELYSWRGSTRYALNIYTS